MFTFALKSFLVTKALTNVYLPQSPKAHICHIRKLGLEWASLMPYRVQQLPHHSSVHELLIDVTFFGQMTLFNGLRRFASVDLTSVCLMIPYFDFIHVPQSPHSTSLPPSLSQSFWYLDTVIPALFLTSTALSYSHSVLHGPVFHACLISSYKA